MAFNKQTDVVAIGCDHGGWELKNAIVAYFKEQNISYIEFGCQNGESIDYPQVAVDTCANLTNGKATCGILVCGTGIGMSIAANKLKGIRAAVCTDHFSTKFTRLHNNTNVLCLGGRVIGPGVALELVDLFLNTDFEGGRHQRRVDAIMDIENF